MPSTVVSPAVRSLFPRGWWKSGGTLMATPPRSYCLNLSNLVPQLVETQCSGFLDLVKFRFTSPVLPEVRILEMLLGRPELPVNAHRDLVQRVKVLARSRPIRNSKLTVHVVFISINCFRFQRLETLRYLRFKHRLHTFEWLRMILFQRIPKTSKNHSRPSMPDAEWFPYNLRQHVKKNTARYVELPLDELEQKFDPEWLKTKVVACQGLYSFMEHFCILYQRFIH